MDPFAGACELISRKYGVKAEFCSCADGIS